MDDKRIENYLTGYLIGQNIRKALETGLALIIVVLMWFVPLWLCVILHIGPYR